MKRQKENDGSPHNIKYVVTQRVYVNNANTCYRRFLESEMGKSTIANQDQTFIGLFDNLEDIGAHIDFDSGGFISSYKCGEDNVIYLTYKHYISENKTVIYNVYDLLTNTNDSIYKNLFYLSEEINHKTKVDFIVKMLLDKKFGKFMIVKLIEIHSV